jgi:hypothetical protein
MALTDAIQIASTALAAVAASAAWVAAKATRNSARATRAGNLIQAYAMRIDALRRIHTDISWLRADGRDRPQRQLELFGRIDSTGLELPKSRELVDHMKETTPASAVIAAAEAELRSAMTPENNLLRRLESQAN